MITGSIFNGGLIDVLSVKLKKKEKKKKKKRIKNSTQSYNYCNQENGGDYANDTEKEKV